MYKSQPYYIKSNNNNSFQMQKRMNTMIYYLFPKTFIYPTFICCKTEDDSSEIHDEGSSYSSSLRYYLKQLEEHTTTLNGWENACQTSNPYSGLVGRDRNRSLVKYEVIELYNLMKFSWDGISHLSTIHMNKCTIHAIEHIRKKNMNDNHFLMDKLSTVADFNKNIKPSSIDIAFCEAASKNEYLNNINLLLQLCVSLCSLRVKGTCIIKFGDTFSYLSLDVIALISHFFEKTVFLKPTVCNGVSCEKYIVCKGFLFDETNNGLRYDTFLKLYSSIIKCPHEKKVSRILHLQIPLFICGKLEEVNSIMGQPRLEKIQCILANMEHATEISLDHDLVKCKEWCEKNNMKII